MRGNQAYPEGAGMSFQGQAGPEQISDPLSVFRKGFGFIPNLLRALMALPRAIVARAKLEEAVSLRDGAIPRIHKERILLSIAADRRDNYWVPISTEVLISLGVRGDHIECLVNDHEHAGLSVPDLALLEFCLKLSRANWACMAVASFAVHPRRVLTGSQAKACGCSTSMSRLSAHPVGRRS
jgi:hypothetical protein